MCYVFSKYVIATLVWAHVRTRITVRGILVLEACRGRLCLFSKFFSLIYQYKVRYYVHSLSIPYPNSNQNSGLKKQSLHVFFFICTVIECLSETVRTPLHNLYLQITVHQCIFRLANYRRCLCTSHIMHIIGYEQHSAIKFEKLLQVFHR